MPSTLIKVMMMAMMAMMHTLVMMMMTTTMMFAIKLAYFVDGDENDVSPYNWHTLIMMVMVVMKMMSHHITGILWSPERAKLNRAAAVQLLLIHFYHHSS